MWGGGVCECRSVVVGGAGRWGYKEAGSGGEGQSDPGGREWRGGAITQTQEAGFAQNAPFIALFNDHEQIIKRHQMSLSAVE